METITVKVLKVLAQYGPLDISSIRRILGIKHTRTVSTAVKRLQRHGFVDCGGWLCKITEKGKTALRYIDECIDVGCLSAKVNS
jgi:Mn-dependent DtxR family transcriptional regulator